MKTIFGASVGILGLCAYGLLAQTQQNGGELFTRDCAMCHQAGNNDRAPSLQALRQLAPEAILTALTTGRMAAQAQRLSPADRKAVAEFAAGRPVATATATSVGQCDSATTTSTSGSNFEASFNKPSWNGWGGALGSARYATNSGIAAADVPRLKLAWAFGFPRALSARTQPTVVGDWLFTASDTGDVFALDVKTGCTRWTYTAKAGVRGALVIAPLGASLGSGKYGVFFGDGQANAYGLDAQTGRQLWTLKVDTHPNAVITGAPTVYDGRLYVPTSGVGEESRGQDPNYACCSFRGSVSAIDIRNGELRWKSYAIQEEPRPRGKSGKGVELLGPAGAGIWSSPTIDAARGVLYVGTGNGYAGPEQKEMNAIIAIDLKTGAHKWVQQTVPKDIWLMQCESQAGTKAPKQVNANCPDEEGPDFDFSSAPLLTKTASGRDLLVVPQKSGVLWALDPDKQGAVVWQYRYGRGSGLGGQWGAAADGVNAYVGTGDALSPQPGGMHAVNLQTGERAWFVPPQQKLCSATDRRCSASQSGAITAIPGVVFSAGGDGGLRAYAAKDGAIVWSFDTNRPFQTVNGVPANGGTMDAAGVVAVGGMLFVNSGYNSFVGRAGNVLLAFRVE